MKSLDLTNVKHVHFVGIGGSGMSVLAEAFLAMGCKVTGSDMNASKRVVSLGEQGIRVSVPHSDEFLMGAQLLCYSSAIPAKNIERKKAESLAIPSLRRGELMGLLLSDKEVVGVAGSHGKTTTSAFMATVLNKLKRPVSLMLGGLLQDEQLDLSWGAETVVAETDESDGTFLYVQPTYGIITNIDREHLSHYGSFENLTDAFKRYFMSIVNMPLVYGDDPVVRSMLEKCKRSCISYGFSSENTLWACEIEEKIFETSFDVVCNGMPGGRFTISLAGKHNILNALAVIGVAVVMGYSLDEIRRALPLFKGVKRRMEIKAEVNGVLFLDDYAHHPTEIKATLEAVKQICIQQKRRLVAMFQPHRFSRVKDCLDDFAKCFDDADLLFVTDIYGAQEKGISGIDSSIVANTIKQAYGEKVIFKSRDEFAKEFLPVIRENDCVLAIGAGDITSALDEIVSLYGVKYG